MAKIDERAELLKAQKALKVSLGKIEKVNREAGRLEAANATTAVSDIAGGPATFRR